MPSNNDRSSLLKRGSLASLGSSMRRGLRGGGSSKGTKSTTSLLDFNNKTLDIVEEQDDTEVDDNASLSPPNAKKTFSLDGLFCSASSEENDIIMDKLGVDKNGCCVRHPNQAILLPTAQQGREDISKCRICHSETKAHTGTKNRNSLLALGNVIESITSMQSDKKEWRARTQILYYSSNDRNINSDDDDSMLSAIVEEEMKHGVEGAIDLEEKEAEWKKGLTERIRQVRTWDESLALKNNPIYKGYYLKLNIGVPLEAVKTDCEIDGNLPWILDLNRDQPLADQLVTEHYKERNGDDEDKMQTILNAQATVTSLTSEVEQVCQAIKKRKEQDDKARLEGRIGTNASNGSKTSKHLLGKGLFSKKSKKSIFDTSAQESNDNFSELQRVVSELEKDMNEKNDTIAVLKDALLQTTLALQELQKRVLVLEEGRKKESSDRSMTTTTERRKDTIEKQESKSSLSSKDESDHRKKHHHHHHRESSSKKRESKLSKGSDHSKKKRESKTSEFDDSDHGSKRRESNVSKDKESSSRKRESKVSHRGSSSRKLDASPRDDSGHKKGSRQASSRKLQSKASQNDSERSLKVEDKKHKIVPDSPTTAQADTKKHHGSKKRDSKKQDSKSKTKKTRTVKKTLKKKTKEPNLDPAHLREVFRSRVKKLVAVNKFFTATALLAFEVQQEVVKKRFTQSKRNKEEARQQPRTVHPGILSPGGLSKRKLAGKGITWVSDEYIEQVHLQEKVYDDKEIRAVCFYSNEEIKLFRFEKFMEEHADEFEIVDSDEEEIIEEIIYEDSDYELEEVVEEEGGVERRLSC